MVLLLCVCKNKSFENIVGKGEIAPNVQFLLPPQCFLSLGKLSAIFVKFEMLSANSFI